ncbi:serine hydrolase domain-containing protein [Actinoplanes sp. HUAS TT8]|uniref:serine hydrolase domain-containing protein n=1 Tax=Actinoplanes sp. HUAS TT8 TaxID=3447453 RepID=UPI003F527663
MPSPRALLPRSTPAASGVSSRAVGALLDRLEARGVECHSMMIVRRGHVVAEGWWAPYSAERPHLLYSLTKSFTALAVGLAVGDGLLSLDDRVVDVLPEHVPDDVCEQGRRLTVHHLLSMTSGHDTDSLAQAWEREPADLVKGFLRVPFPFAEGTQHAYDNATTFVLARMVERVTGRGLPEWLDERLFGPMGIDPPEWDRVGSGATFGFHGLHLTTEAVAAFGELLLREGRWGDRRLVASEWVRAATGRHVETRPVGSSDVDYLNGYGYQFWISRHGYHGDGSFGQLCVVVPSHDLVVATTGAHTQSQVVLDAIWECLLPGIDQADPDDAILADRLRRLSLDPVRGCADGTSPIVAPIDGGWLVSLGPSLNVEVGHEVWRESAPLGRPVVARGAWLGDTFVADVYNITTPHRVRVVVAAGTATVTWNIEPLTGSDLATHLRAPLVTRPDVS